MLHRQKTSQIFLIATLSVMSLLTLSDLLVRIDSMPAEVSMRIECARLITHGKIPYVDFLVLDPPVTLFLSFIPIKLAQLVGVEAGHALASITLVWQWLISAASLALSCSLILKRPTRHDSVQCWCFLLMFAALNLMFIYQFGQPEHMFMLAIIPYILGRWLEYTGSKLNTLETVATGFGAGIGCCLDPYFIPIPLLLELFLVCVACRVPTKLFSSLSVAVLTIITILAFLLIGARSMMSIFIEFMWPLITTHRQLVDIRIYAHDATADCRWMIYFLIFSTLMQLGMRKNGTLSSALTMLGWLGFIWYVAQSDGFTYQALPMFWSASLAFSLNGSLLWLDLARSLKLSASKKWAALFAVVVSTVVSSLVLQETQHSLAASAYSRLGPQEHDIPEATALALRYTQPGDTLLGLTQDATPFYPLITLAERRPGAKLISTTALGDAVLMKMNKYPNKKIADKVSHFYFEELKKSLQTNPPSVIFLCPIGIDLREGGIDSWIHDHYTMVSPARFYTDNVAPREHSSINFNMEVYKLNRSPSQR